MPPLDADNLYIILPDGTLEAAKGRLSPDHPVEEIVFPRVSTDLGWQARYENARLAGASHAATMSDLGFRHSLAIHPDWLDTSDEPGALESLAPADSEDFIAETIEVQSLCCTLMRLALLSPYRAHKLATEGLILGRKGNVSGDFTDFTLPEHYKAFRRLLYFGPMSVPAECEWLDDAPIYPVVSGNPSAQKRYRDMRRSGESHKFAEMIACRAFPAIKSDSIFNEGKFSSDAANGCHAKELWLRQDAEKRGFSTNGLWYCSGLAMFPGDPKAWVGGRGDVERVAKERNLNIIEGYVTHKAHEVAPKPDIEIDPRLIEDETLDIMDSVPDAKYEEVYEKVYNLRTGKVDNNALRVSEPTQDWG